MDRSPITVTVPGSQRKGRARSFIQGAHIAHYTPEKTRAHEGLIRRAALDQLGDKPAVEQPVEFSLRAHFGRRANSNLPLPATSDPASGPISTTF